MFSLIPTLVGLVTVHVKTPEGLNFQFSNPNTLVLEAPKLLLSNMIPYPFSANTKFPSSDPNRPQVGIPTTSQPSVINTLGYMRFGYFLDSESATTPTVSALDSSMYSASNRQVTKAITGTSLNEYGIDISCEFEVLSGEQDRNYVEVGLYSVGQNNEVSSQTALIDPSSNSYDSTSSIMFAHQAHAAVQASVGSTIKYTWTLTMQAPA